MIRSLPAMAFASRHRAKWRRTSAWLVAVLLSCFAPTVLARDDLAADNVPGPEIIDMAPDQTVGWSLRNLTAPLGSIFRGGFGYWYAERTIHVDTTPAGGEVELFYIRRNFQQRFEQARAPVTILLPPRIEAGPRDVLIVRAYREGYRHQSVTIPVDSRQSELVINLEPLPNTLEAVAHRYFAGRSTVIFLTTESPTFRVQEQPDGFGLILSETAKTARAAASIAGLHSPMIASATTQQQGVDLVVTTKFVDGQKIELRSRLSRDTARGLYAFSLDLRPAGGLSVAAAQAALGRLKPEHVSNCNLVFDRTLHSLLEPGALSRALTPRGAFTDPYVRAAMRRLGEISRDSGLVKFAAGVAYRPEVPIELEVALSRAAEAEGFLALLRQFAIELEAPPHHREAFRSLVAPELDPASFGVILHRAEESERECAARQ
jgi:hypothetical protein